MATGDFAVAASGTTCSTSAPVAAGSNCVINVTSTPTASGSRSGSLTLTDNAGGSPQTVSLSGTGTEPVVSLSSPLAFPAQAVGTTTNSQAVTLTNTGNGSLTFTGIAVTGPFAIATTGTTCSTSNALAAAGTCTVAVTFTPTVVGAAAGSLSFSDNAPNNPQTIALSGTGQDFSFAPPSGSSTSTSVAPGSPATYTLSVGGEGGLTGSVSFACTGAPSEASCTVSPNPVTAGNSASNVTVTVTTTAPSLNVPRSPPGPLVPPLSPGLRGLLILALVLASMAWAAMRRNQRGSKYPPAKPEALKTVSRSKRLRGRYRGPAKPFRRDGSGFRETHYGSFQSEPLPPASAVSQNPTAHIVTGLPDYRIRRPAAW